MNPFLAYFNLVINVKMDFGTMWKKKNYKRDTKRFRRISDKKRKKGENFSPGAINILYLFLAAVLELYCN